MAKNLNISVLLDFYAPMLTDKQREVVEFYYNEDLSLSEIAEHSNISRQGVRDSIKRGEDSLNDLESKLHFAERIVKLSEQLDEIRKLAELINEKSSQNKSSNSITENSKHILDIINVCDVLL